MTLSRPVQESDLADSVKGQAASLVNQPPVWRLDDLFCGLEDPKIKTTLEIARARAITFETNVFNRVSQLTAAELAAAIETYQTIEELLGRVTSYAQLRYSADTLNPVVGCFHQLVSETVTDISSHLLFFTLELNRLDEVSLRLLLGDRTLARWRPWLTDLRVFEPFQLHGNLERLLHEKDVTTRAWMRLFDQTIAGLRVSVRGSDVALSGALNMLSDPLREVRRDAARAISEAFGERNALFALIINTLAKDKAVTDRWRNYPTSGSYRNRTNMVEDEVVQALVTAVSSNYPRLSHRYYALKARWLGLDRLEHFDRNAPLLDDSEVPIVWADARERVLSAYASFSPALASIAQDFFDHGWIDADPRGGKAPGAFSHPTVPSVHPYILMNFHGRPRDMMTLAHELGHGVHQTLAAPQGYLMSGTPLTLAETASVFGEALAFRATLEAETSPARRRILLAGKVEDMINTVVRQIAFYQFETKLHDRRRVAELLPEEINALWLEVQTASLGPAFDLSQDYGVYWSYVPHFVHSPFYVYAYAFGDCLVNALYAVFQAGHPGFQEKYIEMLRAGGSKRHRELLAPFGLDASDPAFWQRGLGVISSFIDELETLL